LETTPIDFMKQENGRVVLHDEHGTDPGRNGKIVAMIFDDVAAVIIFSACTAL
jgi:hypothetical protein